MQIFVGNLDPNVSEEELRQIFLQLGEILNVKIPAGKGCGFVEFRARLLYVIAVACCESSHTIPF